MGCLQSPDGVKKYNPGQEESDEWSIRIPNEDFGKTKQSDQWWDDFPDRSSFDQSIYITRIRSIFIGPFN